MTLSREEGICHTAADDECINLLEEVVDNADLVGNLCAAENGNERTSGICESLTHYGDLLLDEVSANCGEVICNARCGSVCSVSRTESVVYVNVCVCRKLLSEVCAVLCLSCVEACVLKENCLAALESRNLCLCILAYDVLCEGNNVAEKLVKSYCNGLECKCLLIVESLLEILCLCGCLLLCGKSLYLLLFLLGKSEALCKDAVGLAHVRAKNYLCALVEKILDCGKCANDSLIAGDNSVLERNVEVATYKNSLAGNVDVLNGFLVVGHFIYPPFKNLFLF